MRRKRQKNDRHEAWRVRLCCDMINYMAATQRKNAKREKNDDDFGGWLDRFYFYFVDGVGSVGAEMFVKKNK